MSNANNELVHPQTSSLAFRWMREWSSLILMASIIAISAVMPTFDPSDLTMIPERVVGVVSMVSGILLVLLYLTFQAWPLAHGAIGSTSAQTSDQLFSILPGLAALFAIFAATAGYFHLGNLQYDMSGYVFGLNVGWVFVVIFDIWVIGGFGNRVNRMVQEKMELK